MHSLIHLWNWHQFWLNANKILIFSLKSSVFEIHTWDDTKKCYVEINFQRKQKKYLEWDSLRFYFEMLSIELNECKTKLTINYLFLQITEPKTPFIAIEKHSRWAIVQAKIANNKITSTENRFIFGAKVTQKTQTHTRKNLLLPFESAANSQLTWPKRSIARLFLSWFFFSLLPFDNFMIH